MKLKVHAGSEPDSFLSEQDFRIVPKLFLLCMMPDAFWHIPLFAIGIATTVSIFRLIRKGQMDGGRRALGRCFDKGAKQDIGKRVEPSLHRDHVRTDDSRVRGIYGDVFVLQPFGKLLGEQ